MRRFAIVAPLILTGCSAQIPQLEPSAGIPLPDAFMAPARPQSGLADPWWKGFGDAELDEAVEKALQANQEIAAARSRLAAAAAIVRAERSDFVPTVDGQISTLADDVTRGRGFSDPEGSLLAAIALDLNGRLSAELAAATANADAAAYFVADQQRLVAAATASQFIEFRRTGARLRLLDQSIALQEQTLNIVQLRYQAGLSSNLDLSRAGADLARTRAQRGLLELDRARSSNALAVLLGTPAAAIEPPAADVEIPRFAGGPAIGVPADLLRRRPDLLVAEAELMRAAAEVGIERADLLPALVLRGTLLSGNGDIGNLLSDLVASVSAILDIPLADAGRRRAEVAAAEYELDARLAEYRQSLLEILGEVETSLTAIAAFGARTNELRESVKRSEAAFRQSDALYREGLASLFDVLDVQRQLISSQEALIDGEAALAQSYIDLYSSIGSPTIEE